MQGLKRYALRFLILSSPFVLSGCESIARELIGGPCHWEDLTERVLVDESGRELTSAQEKELGEKKALKIQNFCQTVESGSVDLYQPNGKKIDPIKHRQFFEILKNQCAEVTATGKIETQPYGFALSYMAPLFYSEVERELGYTTKQKVVGHYRECKGLSIK